MFHRVVLCANQTRVLSILDKATEMRRKTKCFIRLGCRDIYHLVERAVGEPLVACTQDQRPRVQRPWRLSSKRAWKMEELTAKEVQPYQSYRKVSENRNTGKAPVGDNPPKRKQKQKTKKKAGLTLTWYTATAGGAHSLSALAW